MSKEKVFTITKILVAFTLLWELYGPGINHNIVLLLVFPCAFYFAFLSFENKSYLWSSFYFLVSLTYNPLFPVNMSHSTWILINSFVSIFLLINIFSWYFLNYKCASLYNKSQFEKAQIYAFKAFQTAKETFGLNHSCTISSFNDLIDIYKVQGKYMEALAFVEKVIYTWKVNVGSNNQELQIINSKLDEIRNVIGDLFPVKYLESKKHSASTLNGLNESENGQKSLMGIARSLANAAFVSGMKHDFDKAEKLMKYALSICEEADNKSSNIYTHLKVTEDEMDKELDSLMESKLQTKAFVASIVKESPTLESAVDAEFIEKTSKLGIKYHEEEPLQPFYWPPRKLERAIVI